MGMEQLSNILLVSYNHDAILTPDFISAQNYGKTKLKDMLYRQDPFH
jgi:hypothetical protein